jgi:hypothetical protein
VSAERFERHLRWYPPEWRARYGTELVALMEDTYGPGGAPSASDRLGMVRGGISERARRSGFGRGATPPERVRSGCLLVLCGWSLFVVAGSGFAKLSEHWDAVVRVGDRRLPGGAYDAVQIAAGVGLVIVALAALAAVPSFVRLLRHGGWPRVRVPIVVVATAGAAAVLVTLGAVAWSHLRPLPPGARPVLWVGQVPVLGVGWALVVVAAIAVSTVCVVRVAMRLDLPAAVLRLESALALSLTMAMCAVLGGTLAWWVAIAADAPGFASGWGAGLLGAPGALALPATGCLMTAGLALGLWGDTRMLRARRALVR